MNTEDLVGILASLLIALYLLPQLVKLIREKSGENISMLMLFTLIAGQLMWIWYGALKQDLIIITSNIFSALVNLLIIFLSLKYKRKK